MKIREGWVKEKINSMFYRDEVFISLARSRLNQLVAEQFSGALEEIDLIMPDLMIKMPDFRIESSDVVSVME